MNETTTEKQESETPYRGLRTAEPYYTTRQLSDLTGIAQITIRVWRMKGLLKVSARTPSGRPLHRLSDVMLPARGA